MKRKTRKNKTIKTDKSKNKKGGTINKIPSSLFIAPNEDCEKKVNAAVENNKMLLFNLYENEIELMKNEYNEKDEEKNDMIAKIHDTIFKLKSENKKLLNENKKLLKENNNYRNKIIPQYLPIKFKSAVTRQNPN